jgi:hypothetical protein
VQRHHDAVIEPPLLGVRDVDVAEQRADHAARQIRVPGHRAARDREPLLVLDRPFVRVGHADAVRGHVVHEKVREVLGRDHDQRVGLRLLEPRTELVELGVERVAHLRLRALRAARDPGGVAANAGEDEAHRRRSLSML